MSRFGHVDLDTVSVKWHDLKGIGRRAAFDIDRAHLGWFTADDLVELGDILRCAGLEELESD